MPAETSALLGIGSDDAVKVWLNGELVHENWATRPAREDDDLVPVKFRAGPNHLLLKIQNGRESWGFACRLLDAEDPRGQAAGRPPRRGPGGGADVLSHGAQVNGTDKYGFTPVQVARMRGQEQIVPLLVAKGADPNVAMPAAGTPVGFLDLLWSSLKENYPMMEYAGAFDESWHEACKQRIQNMTSLYEALPIMDEMLVRRLNDYHTGLHWEGKRDLVGPPVLCRLDRESDRGDAMFAGIRHRPRRHRAGDRRRQREGTIRTRVARGVRRDRLCQSPIRLPDDLRRRPGLANQTEAEQREGRGL